MLFAAVCTVLDGLVVWFSKDEATDLELAELQFPQLSKPVTVAITAVIAFAVTPLRCPWLVDYLIGEYAAKRYNKMLAELDDEE